MPRLGVNIDHVATLRELRHGIEPEPCFAAFLCQAAGADGIVVHLREDRRHIKDRDLGILKQVVKTKLNLEMSIAKDIVDIACKLKPDQATFVPEKRLELTTEGGLDVVSNFGKIKKAVDKLKKEAIGVSLFIDSEKEQIDASSELGVKCVELHTGRYADAKDKLEQEACFKEIEFAAFYASEKGLQVFAGHGLNYYNVARIARIKCVEELNIGYSIICRAVFVGLEKAVREMIDLVR